LANRVGSLRSQPRRKRNKPASSAVVAGDLEELRTRPWWAMDAAGREMLDKGVPVLWRRGSVEVAGSRAYDVSNLAGVRGQSSGHRRGVVAESSTT
jgi:hypothetical protein